MLYETFKTNMKRLLYIFIALFLINCGKKKGFEDQSKAYKESEILNVSEFLGKSFSIEVIDKHLIVRDDQVTTKFTVFDLEEEPINPIYIGYTGQGPGELITPGPMITRTNEFLVYDASKMQLFPFNLDSLQVPNYKPLNSIPVKDAGIIDIKQVSNDIFIAVGVFPEKRFKLIDEQGNTTCTFGDYPIELINDIPEYVRGMACQSMLTTNKEKHLVAVAMRYGEHIQFHAVDPTKCTTELINEHNVFLPEYTTRDNNGFPNFSPSKKTRWGYISITSNSDFVYALYSGKLQVRGTDFYQGSEVHVFDWQGKFIQKIELDKNAISITCNLTKLYSLYEGEKGFEIAKYELLN